MLEIKWGFSTDIPTNTVYAVDAERVPLKSLMYNNGMFDMTNPNIYKSNCSWSYWYSSSIPNDRPC